MGKGLHTSKLTGANSYYWPQPFLRREIMAQETSPLTGILKEEQVFIDFGEHEGKSVLEISDTNPDFYDYLVGQKEVGNFAIRRSRDKSFRLYVQNVTLN